ncbi:MAG: hypothetical protein HY819_11570 [Acidobacteria bacterium]|nr:hypothetical protein [Acidobacteriota bacterium]
MSQIDKKYSKEEAARIGEEIYEKKIRPQVEDKYKNKVVAIDLETGDYAVGDNAIESSNNLSSLHKVGDVWFVRVGHKSFHRIAKADLREEKR